MASAAPATIRYGTMGELPSATDAAEGAVVVSRSDMVSLLGFGWSDWDGGWGSFSAASTRARRLAANSGDGAIGVVGWRRAARGSVVIVTPLAGARVVAVGASEGDAGAHEQRLGGVDRPPEAIGDVRHRQPVEVAQGQGRLVMGTEAAEDDEGPVLVEL